MEGDSESAAIRPSSAPGSDDVRTIRFNCLGLAQLLVIQAGAGEAKSALELAKQYADFVLSGTLPLASSQK